MAIFKYRAKTIEDRVLEGTLEVENEDVARAMLAEQGVTILALEEQKVYEFANKTIWSRKASKKDIVIFSRQLAVMVAAHIPVAQALKIISAQTENARLKKDIRRIYMLVSAGSKLSEAMANYPKVFDGFYVNMVKSGETSSRLDEVLNYLADQLEKDYDLHRKVRGALMYPMTVIIAMIIASFVVLVYVVPRLVTVFETMNVPVPWTTQLLISLSGFLTSFWWLLLGAAFILFLVVRAYLATYIGQFVFSSIKFKIPVFGRLFKNIYILQITRSLNTLLVGGVNLYESLVIVKDVVQDVQYREVVEKTMKEVRDGQSMASVLTQEKLMPELVANMISIGEQTGKLDYILEKISDYYTKEVDTTTNNIMTLIEPLVMVLLGIGVALIVSAVFLPLYTIPSF